MFNYTYVTEIYSPGASSKSTTYREIQNEIFDFRRILGIFCDFDWILIRYNIKISTPKINFTNQHNYL